MASPKRDQYKAGAGKLLKSDDSEFDLTALLVKLDAVLSAVTGLKVDATLEAADIEVGAVEIKNGADDTRAAVRTDGAENALVTTQNAKKVATLVLQNAAAATGNGTLQDVSGYSTFVFQVRGTFVGTITFEASTDDTNWEPLQTTQIGSAVIGTTATAPGLYRASVGGLKSVRARISAYTSGSITVDGRATNALAEPKTIQAMLYQMLYSEDSNLGIMRMARKTTPTRITTATTTVCKSGAGVSAGVYVEVALTGTATFYDNTAGSGTNPWILPIGTPQGWHEFPAGFTVGWTCVTSAADRLVVHTI